MIPIGVKVFWLSRAILEKPCEVWSARQSVRSLIRCSCHVAELDCERLQSVSPSEPSPLLVLRVVSKLATEREVIGVEFELPIEESMSPVLRHSFVDR